MTLKNRTLVSLLTGVLLASVSADVANATPATVAAYPSAQNENPSGVWTYGGYVLRPPDNPRATGLPEDVIAAARNVRQKAAEANKDITKQMIDIANTQGARLKGLGFRLKSEESIARKVADLVNEEGLDPRQAANTLSDVTRYTMAFPTDQYTDSVSGVLRDLRSDGNSLRVKNYWQQGDNYQGINVAITTAQDIKMELQFHTPRSLQVKQDTHRLYEAMRVSKSNDERWTLYGQLAKASMRIPMPSWKVLSIGNLIYLPFKPIERN